MRVVTDITKISAEDRGAVVVIGNFDGVHKGHRALLARARNYAAKNNAPLAVLTFDPHPRAFFKPDAEPFSLTSWPQKQRLLEAEGVDVIYRLDFDTDMSLTSADDFVSKILVAGLGVKAVLVGQNFRYGHKAMGDVDHLIYGGSVHGFNVEIVDLEQDLPEVATADNIASSSRIRVAIRDGDFKRAHDLLGGYWTIEGPVLKGDQRGRELGYPTANQSMRRYLRPKYGVYAVRCRLESDQDWRYGVANMGIRPMFEIDEPLLETHIFDFDKEVYGENLRVQLIAHLRDEMYFESLDDLIVQMDKDSAAAKNILNETFGNATGEARKHG